MVAIDVEDFGCRLSVVGYRLGSLDCARDDSCGLWVVGWHSGLILNANQKYEFDLECGIALDLILSGGSPVGFRYENNLSNLMITALGIATVSFCAGVRRKKFSG